MWSRCVSCLGNLALEVGLPKIEYFTGERTGGADIPPNAPVKFCRLMAPREVSPTVVGVAVAAGSVFDEEPVVVVMDGSTNVLDVGPGIDSLR